MTSTIDGVQDAGFLQLLFILWDFVHFLYCGILSYKI